MSGRRVQVGRCAGFTLVEVLVALVVMAVLATLAWRGTDGMLRARQASGSVLDATTRLATVITQWEQDLFALRDDAAVPALAFDGRTLLLARDTGAGVQIVAWSLRGDRWQRWASPPAVRAQALQDNWLRAQQLLGDETAQVRALDGIAQWQLYYYRGNAWTNAQSTGDLQAEAPAPPASGAAAQTREALPTGVRLLLGFADGRTLTRDVRLAPQMP
jgi:general secretion pathway protein J